jgi:hypothetical protein
MADQNTGDEQRKGSTSGDANVPATPSQAEGERGNEGIDRTGRDDIGESGGGPGSTSQSEIPNTPSQAEG